MKEFKVPDLKAARYRSTALTFDNAKTHKEFQAKYPHHSDMESRTFSKIIKVFNGLIWRAVVENRDGVQLPESLGHLFIGTCPAPKKTNINFHASAQHGVAVQNRNWETDNKIAKIFYTNYYEKYRFANRELWTFQAVRQFKRTVAKEYPESYQRYVVMSPDLRISSLYRSILKKEYFLKKAEQQIEDYDEFKID